MKTTKIEHTNTCTSEIVYTGTGLSLKVSSDYKPEIVLFKSRDTGHWNISDIKVCYDKLNHAFTVPYIHKEDVEKMIDEGQSIEDIQAQIDFWNL